MTRERWCWAWAIIRQWSRGRRPEPVTTDASIRLALGLWRERQRWWDALPAKSGQQWIEQRQLHAGPSLLWLRQHPCSC